MKAWRFTARADVALEEIFSWTISTFGLAQAEKYVDEIVGRCRSIASGTAQHRSCRDGFAPGLKSDLRFSRAGRYFILFLDSGAEIQIVDVVHQSADIAGRLAEFEGSARP